MDEADVNEPGLGEAVGEAAAGFAGGIRGAAKQAVLIAVEEDAGRDEEMCIRDRQRLMGLPRPVSSTQKRLLFAGE